MSGPPTATPLVADDPAAEAGFAPLFDGKSFDGWEGNRELFRIEQGAIVEGTRVAFEDDILVTEDGHEWLTRFIPIEIDEVELGACEIGRNPNRDECAAVPHA